MLDRGPVSIANAVYTTNPISAYRLSRYRLFPINRATVQTAVEWTDNNEKASIVQHVHLQTGEQLFSVTKHRFKFKTR